MSQEAAAPRVEIQLRLSTGHRGRKRLSAERRPRKAEPRRQPVPRLAQLLALAHRWDRLLENGKVASYGEIARLAGLSRARVSQIMALLNLAPDIQEQVLLSQRDPTLERLTERSLRALTALSVWGDQRLLWRSLTS